MLWLWCRPAAIALIRLLVWELTCAMVVALKSKNKTKQNKNKNPQTKNQPNKQKTKEKNKTNQTNDQYLGFSNNSKNLKRV